MKVKRLTPILNVSNIVESFAWFEKLGWQKGWDWGDPPTFGGVCNGDVEIFLCQMGKVHAAVPCRFTTRLGPGKVSAAMMKMAVSGLVGVWNRQARSMRHINSRYKMD